MKFVPRFQQISLQLLRYIDFFKFSPYKASVPTHVHTRAHLAGPYVLELRRYGKRSVFT